MESKRNIQIKRTVHGKIHTSPFQMKKKGGSPPPSESFLLLETGDEILLETVVGSILIE